MTLSPGRQRIRDVSDPWQGRDQLLFTVPGPPVPKARPRWAPHGGTYTAPRTVATEQRIAQYLKAAYPHLRPAEGRMGLAVEVHLTNARRADGDNFLKLVMDALNGKAWRDDSQLDRVYVELFRQAAAPMTTIRVYRL